MEKKQKNVSAREQRRRKKQSHQSWRENNPQGAAYEDVVRRAALRSIPGRYMAPFWGNRLSKLRAWSEF